MNFDEIKELVNRTPDTTKCRHNPNKEKCSLLFLKTIHMTTPQEFHAVCPVCGKAFTFIEKGTKLKKI